MLGLATTVGLSAAELCPLDPLAIIVAMMSIVLGTVTPKDRDCVYITYTYYIPTSYVHSDKLGRANPGQQLVNECRDPRATRAGG